MIVSRQLPQTEPQLNLIFHLDDVVEGLDEVRSSLRATLCEKSEVRVSEPVSKPKLEIEEAIELLFELSEETLLFFRAQRVSLSHLSEL